MSESTILYLSSRWDPSDIVDVIEKNLPYTVEVNLCKSSPGYLIFYLTGENKEKRFLNVFLNYQTPIGSVTYISAQANIIVKDILLTIANILGGAYMESDYNENIQFINGKLWEEDALSFLLKRAVIEGKLESSEDIEGLNKFIKNWKEKIKK